MKLWVDIQKTSKGKEKPQVFVQTENYPGPKDIVDGKDDEKERYKNIKAYNFKDYKDCDDFSFIQEKSLAILKSNYQTEHALEGQALSSFINDLSAGPKYDNLDPFNQMQDEKVTFCNLMLPYWRTEYDDKANELKVVDGKKYPDDNQDKEGKNSAATPAEWLASALPSRWSNWDEFMLLYTPVNGMKGRLWQDQPLVTEGANSEGKNMESLLDFKIAQVSNEDLKGLKSKDKKKLIKHDKIFGLEKAIEKWREVYGVYIYCSDKHFVKVFQDQVKRVAEMFDVLDKKELPKIKLRSTRRNPDKKQKDDVRDWPAWKPLELKQKWNDYIKERTGSRIKNLDDWLKKWHDAIQGVRGDLVKERDSAKGKKEKSEDSKERVDYLDKFIDRIDAVKKAFDNKGELKNPLA
ncbi:hypothetical protein BU16DRAFT_541360 [Lophium mytilinum]|uniref:Uncharacterized protein n=1 Tax=Lophium mytilinum TaxID=390894 RepID=A0A6A6QKP1_9PEZI|nr:hypothetical protein BU16DRAFT_541360 [Lophium mytilinum]